MEHVPATKVPDDGRETNTVEVIGELLTERAAVRIAGVSRMTLHRARKEGKLRCYKLGSAVRFSRKQLSDWFAASEAA